MSPSPRPRPRRAALFAGAALLCLCALSARARASVSARAATLLAIHELENPRDLPTPGPRGELGAYQFRESTWRCYTDEPFSRALDRAASDAVAGRHYAWLRGRLEQHGLPATPYNIALAWNAGVAAAVSGRAPACARDYAERASNLAAEFAGAAVASR